MTDASRRTGFGTCAHNICKGLHEKYNHDMYHLGWGYISEDIAQREGYKLLPSDNSFGSVTYPGFFIVSQMDTYGIIRTSK